MNAVPETRYARSGDMHLAYQVLGDHASDVALAHNSEVLTSRTIRDLVARSGLRLESRGTRALKGVPDEWEVFAVIV